MMPEFILYLLKVNLALLLFYAGYHFILQRYTFYTVNRFYLLIGLVYSALYPSIDISEILSSNDQLKDQITLLAWQGSLKSALLKAEEDAGYYWQITLIVFWIGVVFMSLRLLIQLSSLLALHVQSSLCRAEKITFRKISRAVNPFSFWRTIYLNPECHEAGELRSILEHEQVHVKQLHTIDVMLAEVSTIFYWFNPGVWLMKKAIKTNLEFITDHEVIRSGIDSKEYQYNLLKTQIIAQNSMPVNNFHFLTIKKRIAMINKKPSNRINLSNYVLLLPTIMLLVLITGISRAEYAGKAIVEASTNLQTSLLPGFFNNELKNGIKIINSDWLKPNPGNVERKSTAHISVLDTNKNRNGKINVAKKSSQNIIVKSKSQIDTAVVSQPLYVVDGKRMTKAQINLNPEDIAIVNVFKGEGATSQYGEEGKNGVIEIRTKSVVVSYGPNQNQDISLTGIDKELIILDGKEITKTDLDQLKINSIGSINILKGESAVSKYGEKGQRGVIVITSK